MEKIIPLACLLLALSVGAASADPIMLGGAQQHQANTILWFFGLAVLAAEAWGVTYFVRNTQRNLARTFIALMVMNLATFIAMTPFLVLPGRPDDELLNLNFSAFAAEAPIIAFEAVALYVILNRPSFMKPNADRIALDRCAVISFYANGCSMIVGIVGFLWLSMWAYQFIEQLQH